MDTRPSIGFVGLGAMGFGMAANILSKHGQLAAVANTRRDALDKLVQLGATEYPDCAALADACDVLLLCLPNSEVVEAVIDDMSPALCHGKTVIDTGTSSLASTQNIAKALEAKGCQFAEAPLTGGTKQAEAGELGALVGAPDDVFAEISPILEMFCASVQHFGPVGAGAKAKFVNNYMVMGVAAVVCEAFSVASLTGSDWGKLYDVVIRGSADSGVFRRIVGNAKDGDFEGYVFSVENALKDMRYITEMNASLGRETPLNAAVLDFFSDAERAGFGDRLLSELLRPEIRDVLLAPKT
jgi:3-hydroxyisobutyrate dehydrogenase-like beta-hydroxyacid dehydrogenase